MKAVKKHTEKSNKRLFLLLFAIVGCAIFIAVGYAWYSKNEREAVTQEVEFMKPYRLSLRNASESDSLQLSVGSLQLNQTKQIVFAVCYDNEEDITGFNYDIELIHTDNLALDYKLHQLTKAQGEADADITVEDILVNDESTTEYVTYWKKSQGSELLGKDVSDVRHEQANIDGDEVNSGTYMLYSSTSNMLYLSSEEENLKVQYFVLEISWKDEAYVDFDRFEKETDMIYLTVKAVSPKPQKAVR